MAKESKNLSTQKRARQSVAKRLFNRAIRSQIRTLTKKMQKLIKNEKNWDEVKLNHLKSIGREYVVSLDKAGKKKIVHKNFVNRKKSIWMKRLHAFFVSQETNEQRQATE